MKTSNCKKDLAILYPTMSQWLLSDDIDLSFILTMMGFTKDEIYQNEMQQKKEKINKQRKEKLEKINERS